MNAKTLKIAATAVVLVAGAVRADVYDAQRRHRVHKQVDEVMADPAAWQGKPMNLHGYVVDKSIFAKPNTLDYRFQIQSNGKVVAARYTGVVPDTFKDGSEVVLKGRLGPHGSTSSPNGVMAKCPSKYEASKTPATPG